MRHTLKTFCVGLWFLAAGTACMGPGETENPGAATVALSLPGGTVATVGVTPGKTQGYLSMQEDGQTCEVAVAMDGKSVTTLAAAGSSLREGSACSLLDATVLSAPTDAPGNDITTSGCCIKCNGWWACGDIACCGSRCCNPQ